MPGAQPISSMAEDAAGRWVHGYGGGSAHFRYRRDLLLRLWHCEYVRKCHNAVESYRELEPYPELTLARTMLDILPLAHTLG